MEKHKREYVHVLDAGTFGLICEEDYREELDRIIFLARLFSKNGFSPGDRIYLLRSEKMDQLPDAGPVPEREKLKKLKRKEKQRDPSSSKNGSAGSACRGTVIVATSRQVEHFLAKGIDDFEDVPLEEAVRTWRI